MCLAVHPEGNFVATGQMGKDPYVCIWDSVEMEMVAKLEGYHSRGIGALKFSADGLQIATVGLDDDHTIAVWD